MTVLTRRPPPGASARKGWHSALRNERLPVRSDEGDRQKLTKRRYLTKHYAPDRSGTAPIQTQKEVYLESGYTFSFPTPQSNGSPRMGLSRNRGVFPHPGAGNSVYGKTWPFRYVRMYKVSTNLFGERLQRV